MGGHTNAVSIAMFAISSGKEGRRWSNRRRVGQLMSGLPKVDRAMMFPHVRGSSCGADL